MVFVLTSVVPIAAGCGGAHGGPSSSTGAANGGPPPASLVGSYATTLKPSDIPPNAPPELTQGSRGWTLRIASQGGANGTPAFTIANGEMGVLESPSLSVAGKTLLLHREECPNRAGTNYAFVNSRYRWALRGKTLRLSDGKGFCADKVAVTILTAEPWSKR
jgi:hypothetical protein